MKNVHDVDTNIFVDFVRTYKLHFNLSRNNQQMSRHSTSFPVNSLHVSDTECVRNM
jgi:hypothetical protein